MDIRGIRLLSTLLPKLMLPPPVRSGKHILKTIHGVRMLIDPSIDKGVELSLYETGTYEKGTVQLLGDFLRPGSVFIDIGANIGLMSAIASRKVGASGKVIAVEANPETVEILRYNLALNDCDNVEVYPIALGSGTGTAILYENWNVNRGGASLLSQGDETGTEVPVARLEDLFSDIPATLIKMDVEGYELEVLKGGAEYIRRCLPVLIIEVSELREGQKGVSPREVMDFVSSLGNYKFFRQKGTKERRSKLIPIATYADLPEHDNIICIPLKRS